MIYTKNVLLYYKAIKLRNLSPIKKCKSSYSNNMKGLVLGGR